MKILVTGGCGYIGSHTVIELLNNNFDVVIIDNLENSKEEIIDVIEEISGKKVEYVKGDIKSKCEIDSVMKNIEAVIHFAAYKSVTDSVKIPLEYFENNVV